MPGQVEVARVVVGVLVGRDYHAHDGVAAQDERTQDEDLLGAAGVGTMAGGLISAPRAPRSPRMFAHCADVVATWVNRLYWSLRTDTP